MSAPPIAAPRSGVARLTASQVRHAMLNNGWGVIPIRAHDDGSQSAGKAPTLTGWTDYAAFDAPLPTLTATKGWGRFGTGIPCGDIVGVDIDVMDERVVGQIRTIAFQILGETPFERVGRAPRKLLAYRAAEPIPSTSYTATDGNKLELLSGGKQFVAYGVHPKSLRPYEWVGAESPLTAGPDDAPAISADQVEAFVTAVRAVMPFQAEGLNGHAGGGLVGITRDADGFVVDGRESHLTKTVYRIAAEMSAEGGAITLDGLTERAWDAVVATTNLADGKWKVRAVRDKARGLLRKVAAGRLTFGTAQGEAESTAPPTYPDRSVPVEQAREATKAVVRRFIEAVDAWRAEQAREQNPFEEAAEALGVTPPSVPPVFAGRISTGIGKSTFAAEGAAERQDLRFGYEVPRHDLGDVIAKLFEPGHARVVRGRDAPDPDNPGQKMCRTPEIVAAAVELSLPVSTSCCKGKTLSGQEAICPFYHGCSYQKQLQNLPHVVSSAHEMLFLEMGAIGKPDGVIVDESFLKAGEWRASSGVALDEFIRKLPVHPSGKTDTLQALRKKLHAALTSQPEAGAVARKHLVAAELTAEECSEAFQAEWARKEKPMLHPGMDAEHRAHVLTLAKGVRHTRRVAGVWEAARGLLEDEDEAATSGRLWTEETETSEGAVRVVKTRGIKKIKKQWQVPTLILDATLPDIDVLRAFYPQVEIIADIVAEAPHERVEHILNAPVSRRGLFDKRSDAHNNLHAHRRLILDYWVKTGRGKTLVVCQGRKEKEGDALQPPDTPEAWLKRSGLPDQITIKHFNAVSGLDEFRDARLVIVIGRTQPGPAEFEARVGAYTGREPIRASSQNENGRTWFDTVTRRGRLRNGRTYAVACDQHPDPLCEALRLQVCEAGMMQAGGRGRGANRPAETPLDTVYIADVCLDVTVDTVRRWEDIQVSKEIDMVAAGIWIESPADMAKCWPAVWGSAKAAEHWIAREAKGGVFPPQLVLERYPIIRVGGEFSTRTLNYRPRGPGQQTRRACFDPAVVPDPRGWLEARLGRLAHFEIEFAALDRLFDAAVVPSPPATAGVFVCTGDPEPRQGACLNRARWSGITARYAKRPTFPDEVEMGGFSLKRAGPGHLTLSEAPLPVPDPRALPLAACPRAGLQGGQPLPTFNRWLDGSLWIASAIREGGVDDHPF